MFRFSLRKRIFPISRENSYNRGGIIMAKPFDDQKKSSDLEAKKDYIRYLRAQIGHQPCLSVGLTALIVNEKNEILVEKRTDNGLYCFPGGSLDYEEKIVDGLKREVREETGIALHKVQLFALASGPSETLLYPNGDITNYVDLTFYCPVQSSNCPLKISDGESTALFFVALENFPSEKECLRGTYLLLEKLKRGDFSITID